MQNQKTKTSSKNPKLETQFWNLTQLHSKNMRNPGDLLDDKNKPMNDRIFFSGSESTTPSSMKGKRRKKIHTFANQ